MVVDFTINLPVDVVSGPERQHNVLFGLLGVLSFLLEARHVFESIPDTGGFLYGKLADLVSSVKVPSVDTLLGVLVNWALGARLCNLKRVESIILVGGGVGVQEAWCFSNDEGSVNSIIEVFGVSNCVLVVEGKDSVSKILVLLSVGKRSELDISDWAVGEV